MAEKMTVEKAAEILGQGFHCSQCVMSHAADLGLIDRDLALRASAGLGGGCFHGDVCGTVSGAVMALSLVYGFDKPYAAEQNAILVEKVNEFEKRFIEKNGSIVCKDLLGGYSFAIPEESEKIMGGGLTGILKNCPGYCATACEILDDIVKDDLKK